MEEVGNFRHPGQTVAVEVEWDDSDGAGKERHAYRVRRELDGGQAWLYRDGQMVQKGPRAVTDETERALGIPYELFSRAVYSEQNRLDAWLTLPPGSRKAELDRLLGLDRFEAARAAATSAHNQAQARAAAAEAGAPAEKLDGERKSLAERRAQLEKRRGELGEKKAELASLEKEALAHGLQWEGAEKTRKEREDLQLRLQKAAGSISALEKMLAGLPQLPKAEEAEAKLAALQTARASIEAEMKARHEAQGEASRKSGALEEQLKNERTRSSHAQALAQKEKQLLEGKSIEAIRKELENARTALQTCLADAAGFEKEKTDLLLVLKTLTIHAQGESAACPVCRQTLDEKQRQTLEEERRGRVRVLEQKMAESNKQAGLGRKNVEKLTSLDTEVSKLQAQMAALGSPIDAGKMQKELDENKQGALALAAQVTAGRQKAGQLADEEGQVRRTLEQGKQAAQWKSQLESSQKERANLEQKLSSLAFDESAYLLLKQKREEMTGRSARLSEAMKGLEKMAAQDAQLAQMQEKVVGELEKKREEAQNARKEMDELAAFRVVLASTQTALRERLLGDLNDALARLWPLLYPYGDWSRVRLTATEKDYAVEIQQGEWKSLEAHASGGERACLGLALRVALSVLLTPQLGWLILDEPTHNLDSRAVQSLGVALAERIPQIIPQVIVITHEQQLVESTPGRVIRFSRDKLKGEDTQVEVEGEI
jgi:DNA repair exonuclease SbcCD ATPase subunit